jgi:hypothetical protein
MAKRTEYTFAIVTMMLLAVASAAATSHVRIVRLSYADGNVQMDRTTGQGLERAILNSPIVEGSRIVTGTDGLAEVEFENNSTVRLGEVTEVKFRQLLINDAGDKVNEVELLRGTMYFDARSGKGAIYRVIAAGRTFVLRHDSSVRFMMAGDQVQASVLNGEAQFEDNAQLVRIKKNDTITADAANSSGFTLAKGVDQLPLDRWNSERAAYQTVYAYNNYGYGSRSLSAYGYQDLAYYGGFMSLPGYGLVWQPYGASNWLGWDPYMSGAWAYTPGFGYAWASAYPWGWMPYHYGSWGYLSGTGWFWCPGNAFNGGGVVKNWQAAAPVVNGPAGYMGPTVPVATSNGHKPSVLVGQIGRMPAYLPGGPVPPNFRSVITDHSSITGLRAPLTSGSGGGGSSVVARNTRAANLSGANSTAAKSNTFVAPAAGTSKARFDVGSAPRNTNSGGHVFETPASQAWTSDGFVSRAPSFGGGGGAVQHGAGGSMRGGGSSASGGGMSHATSSGGAGASSTSGASHK